MAPTNPAQGRFGRIMSAMPAPSLRELIVVMERQRRAALETGNATGVQFCEDRIALIETELTRRGEQ